MHMGVSQRPLVLNPNTGRSRYRAGSQSRLRLKGSRAINETINRSKSSKNSEADLTLSTVFTTKPTGEGTGLGVSISYDIVTQQHGRTITVDSRVGERTEFIVRLPRAYRATMAEV